MSPQAARERRAPAPLAPLRWALPVLALALLPSIAAALGAPGPTPSARVSAGAMTVPAPVTNTSVLDLGMPLNLSVNVSAIVGGTNNSSNWRYEWLGLPLGCPGANAANYSCRPSAAGALSVRVEVKDTVADVNGTSPPLAVQINPAISVTAFTASPTSVPVGGTIDFRVNASGGTPPLVYNYRGLPAGCAGNASTIACVVSAPHVYNSTVYVTDAVNASSSVWSLSVTVVANRSSAAAHPTAEQWGIIGAILIVGTLLVAALLVAARRTERAAYGRAPRPGPPAGGSSTGGPSGGSAPGPSPSPSAPPGGPGPP